MDPNYCVLIPVFDNPTTIGNVVERTLATCSYPVIVVDDGSATPVKNCLPAHERLTVLREESNQGKGAALKRGFAWAAARGFTHAITIDGDGQHSPEDIPVLVAAADRSPWALIIGSRKMATENVPRISLFGRNFSNFWVRYQTTFPVSDSQSGFRLYPLFRVQCLNLKRDRYDFEIEVLVKLLWQKTPVVEVPVNVFYPPAEKRVSHFRKFVDNARISWLNCFLVGHSILRAPTRSRPFALAIAVGVLIGCSPFFGLHTPIAIAVAILFRLHFPALFLGTQISLPFLAPLIAFASIHLGARWIGQPLDLSWRGFQLSQAAPFFNAWLLGGLAVGAGLGIVLGLLAYAVHRRWSRPGQRVNWTGRSRGGRFGNWFVKEVTLRLGIRVGYALLFFIVPYFYLFAPKGRRAAQQYWRVIQPERSGTYYFSQILRHFFVFGQVILDRLYQSYRSDKLFYSNQFGMEHITRAASAKTGVLLLGVHAGGWDIAARYLEWGGLRSEFHPVQLHASGVRIENNFNPEEKAKVEHLKPNQEGFSILEIYTRLDQGKPVGLMADRPTTKHFVLVPFLGKLSAWDTTPFRVAATTGRPVIFSVGFKGEGMAYDFYASVPKTYQFEAGKSRDEQLRIWVSELTQFLEPLIRRYPYQWFNFYEFWSSPPDLDPTEKKSK